MGQLIWMELVLDVRLRANFLENFHAMYVAGFLHKNRCIYNKKKPTFDYQKLFRFLSHSSTQFQVDNAKKAKYSNNFCAISSIVHAFFRVSTIQLLHIMYILMYEDVKKVCCSYYGSE